MASTMRKLAAPRRSGLTNARVAFRLFLGVLLIPMICSVLALAGASASASAPSCATSSAASIAGVSAINPLSEILCTVQSASAGWFAAGVGLVKTLFVTLAAADIAWTGIQTLLHGAEDIKAVIAGISEGSRTPIFLDDP